MKSPSVPPPELHPDSLVTFNPVRLLSTTRFASPKPVTPRQGGAFTELTAGTMSNATHGMGDQRPVEYTSGFTLRRILGSGGFGEVWEARQESLGRLVAVKRLREDRSLDSESSGMNSLLRSFRQEALTNAVLDHPNIVPVHELTVDGDEPMLVMKLVRGRPWNELLQEDHEKLSREDFLAKHLTILADVTRAVAFAHSRGILHRDLKPQQVMIGEFGETLLADWGLAILFDPDAFRRSYGQEELPDTPTKDEASSPAGTPAYMAPEQTEMDGTRLGPWTDCYLLAGCLRKILTGFPPRTPPKGGAQRAYELASVGYVDPLPEGLPADLVELINICFLVDPRDRTIDAKGFDKVLRDHLSGASARREARELQQRIERTLDDLDTQKAGKRDYGILNESQGLLQRSAGLWAGNQDLPALRDRLAQTYAGEALAKGDVALARLHAESIVTAPQRQRLLAQASRTIMARRAAMGGVGVLLLLVVFGAMQRAQEQTRFAETIAKERDRAVDARGRAEDLMDFMLRDLRGSLKGVGRLDLLDPVTAKAQAYFQQLPVQDLTDTSLSQRATTILALGEVYRERGDTKSALKAMDEAVGIARNLVEAPGATIKRRLEFATALATRGVLQTGQGNLDPAFADINEGIEMLRRVPETATADERAMLESMLATLLEKRQNVTTPRGQLELSLQSVDESLKIRRRLASETPDSAPIQDSVAQSLSSLARVQSMQGEQEAALDSLKEAITIRRVLAEKSPLDARTTASLADILVQSGDIRLGDRNRSVLVSDPAGAAKDYTEAGAIFRRLSERDPSNVIVRRQNIAMIAKLGDIERAKGNMDAAIEALHEVVEQRRKLSEMEPSNLLLRDDMAVSMANYGAILSETSRTSDTLAAYYGAVDTWKDMIPADSTNTNRRRNRATVLSNISDIYRRAGDHAQSLKLATESIEERRGLLRKDPTNARFMLDLGESIIKMGAIMERENKLREAVAFYEEGLPIWRSMMAKDPKNPNWYLNLSTGYYTNAGHLRTLGDIEEATFNADICLPMICDLLKTFADNPPMFGEMISSAAFVMLVQRENHCSAQALETAASVEAAMQGAPLSTLESDRFRETYALFLGCKVRALRDVGKIAEARALNDEITKNLETGALTDSADLREMLQN